MRSFYGKLEHDETPKTVTLTEGAKLFQTYNIAKNLSPRTIEYYDMGIKSFKAFFGADRNCNEIEENTVFSYIAYLRQQNTRNDISINSYLRIIRTMCYYFMKFGYTRRFQIQMIKATKQVKETYTDEELTILLKKPNMKNTTFAEYRNWVVINYLLATGNREGTLCNVKIKDVDFNTDTIRLTKTKNRREQIIPMSKTIRAILTDYLKLRKGDPEEYLFCNVHGRRLEENAVRIAIMKYNRKRGVNKTSVHLFRHTFAKKWILNGGDVFRLQKILGHSSMEIVREYVNMFSDDLKRDFDVFNPLEEFSNRKKGDYIEIKPKKNRIKI